MSVLGDAWDMLPGQVKFLLAIAIFLYTGATLINAMLFLWNVLGVSLINAANGCLSNPDVCIPAQKGFFILGVNIADYWTITLILLVVPIAQFALWWYSHMLKKD